MWDGNSHPLKDVPQEVLDIARANMQDMLDLEAPSIHPELVDAMADSMVMVLHEAGYIQINKETDV